jgi:hypothetical protein
MSCTAGNQSANVNEPPGKLMIPSAARINYADAALPLLTFIADSLRDYPVSFDMRPARVSAKACLPLTSGHACRLRLLVQLYLVWRHHFECRIC